MSPGTMSPTARPVSPLSRMCRILMSLPWRNKTGDAITIFAVNRSIDSDITANIELTGLHVAFGHRQGSLRTGHLRGQR